MDKLKFYLTLFIIIGIYSALHAQHPCKNQPLSTTKKNKILVQDLTGLLSYKALNKGFPYISKTDFNKLGMSYINVGGYLNSENASISLTLHLNEPIFLNIIDNNEFKLNLAPCHVKNGATEIPLMVFYIHEIKKYLPEFELSNFKYTPIEYYKILLAISGIDEEDLFERVIDTYFESDKEIFLSHFNDLKISHTPVKNIDEITDILKKKGIDSYTFIYEKYIKKSHYKQYLEKYNKSKNNAFVNLSELFNTTIGSQYKFYPRLNDMLNPAVSASINGSDLILGLIIPNLISINDDTIQEYSCMHDNTNLICKIKESNYSTYHGFEFKKISHVVFKNSMIGNSEISLYNHDSIIKLSIKLDNENQNIKLTRLYFKFPDKIVSKTNNLLKNNMSAKDIVIDKSSISGIFVDLDNKSTSFKLEFIKKKKLYFYLNNILIFKEKY